MAAAEQIDGEGVATDLALKPRGSRGEVACKVHTGDASAGASNCSGKDLALDSWSYYNTYRLINDSEEPIQPNECPRHPPPSPDYIPGSDPDNTPASGEADNNEEDHASVPSTVHVGTSESKDPEPRDLSSPRKSPGGFRRNLDGS